MRTIAAFGALSIVGGAISPGGAASNRPRLVVLLVADQMRADYVDRFQSEWHGGLHRLARDGAWFRAASYPYLNTVTCPGHATIATGAFPRTHGMIHNSWWDRGEGHAVACTEDVTARNIGYEIGRASCRGRV